MRQPTSRAGRRRAVVRLFFLLLLGVAVLTGAGVAAGTQPAWADPTPAPTPGTGVPDPGVPPSPNPAPGTPKATPSPIGPPPTSTPTPTAPSTPAPTQGPTPPGWTPPADNGGDPGLFDIPGQIRKAINDFLLWIAKTGLKPVMDTLGQTVLSTPDLTGNAQVTAFWTTSLVAANGIFVLFVMAGGFIVASRETLQTSYGLKEIAPRVVVAGVAANVSLLVAGKAIEAVNALTAAIAGQGVDGQAAVTAISQMLGQPTNTTSMPPILFSLLILAALVMAIVVVMTFVLRIAMLVLLIGVAPLALMCHATPQTEGLAYAWWRAIAACLGIQLGQAVIILATVRVFLTPDGPQVLGMPATTGGLLGVLVCLTMLWLLIKLPSWMKHLILGPLARRHGRGLIGQIIHAVVMLKTLGALAGAGGRASRTRASGRPRSGPGTGTGPSPTRGPSPSGPTPGTSRARPRSGSVPSPSRSRPGRWRAAPAPVGPAAFSSAPAHHTPLPAHAGSASSPVFSSAPTPTTPRSAPPSPAAPARFSHQPTAPAPTPPASSRPAPAQFSHARTPATPARSAGPAPAATFSAASRPQTAPKRPPAPVTPLFSSPARPAPTGSRATPARPAPASSRSAVPFRSPASSPPSPRSSRASGRAPSPPVPPSPASSPSPSARAARPLPQPSPAPRSSPSPRSSQSGASSPSRRSRQDSPQQKGEH
jgi:hypothetical protein